MVSGLAPRWAAKQPYWIFSAPVGGQAPSPQQAPSHILISSVWEIEAAQNAGLIAPLYFSSMNFFTSGVCRAATSFFTASESLLSSRVTRMFT